jgi:hypothetical protein
MDDYFLMSDEALERLYRDLENDIQRFSDDDLRDPALFYEYMELCRQLDDVVMEGYLRRHDMEGGEMYAAADKQSA